MKFVKCLAIFFAFILIRSVTDAQDIQNPPEPLQNSKQLEKNDSSSDDLKALKEEKTKSDKYQKELEQLQNEFSVKCSKTIEKGSSSKLYLFIFAYKQKANKFKELGTPIKTYLNKYAAIRNTEISCIDDKEKKAKMLFELCKAFKQITNNKEKAKMLILQAISLTEDVEFAESLLKEYYLLENDDWDDDDDDGYGYKDDEDNSNDKKSDEGSNRIGINMMLPEIESPIVAGLRVNIFAAKKKYKLGEPIIIYTVIRNKSDKTIELKIDYDHKSQLCFFDYSYTDGAGINVQRFCRWTPQKIENNITPNAVFCYENDYKSTLNKPNRVGKIKFMITISKEIENNKYAYIESNTIEFEVVN